MRLRCKACGKLDEGSVDPESGYMRVRVRVKRDGRLTETRTGVTIAGEAHRLRCVRCGALYEFTADELGRVARLASERGRRELVAGDEVGRRLR